MVRGSWDSPGSISIVRCLVAKAKRRLGTSSYGSCRGNVGIGLLDFFLLGHLAKVVVHGMVPYAFARLEVEVIDIAG